MRTRPFPSRRNRLVVEMPAGEGLDINCTRLLCRPSSDNPEPTCETVIQSTWDAVNCVRFGFVAGDGQFCPSCDPSIGTSLGDLPDGFNLSFDVYNGENTVTMEANFNSELAGGDISAYSGGTASLYAADCSGLVTAETSIMQGDGDSLFVEFEGATLVEGQTYYIQFCPTTPPGE